LKAGLQYISHGEKETGGYAHEKTLFESIAKALDLGAGDCQEIRFRRRFKGLFGWFRLGFLAFKAAGPNATIITVARLAWPVFLKQLFGRGKMLVVVHNYDPFDKKPRLYYRVLNAFLRMASRKTARIRLVVVAKHWQQLFKEKWGISAMLFPNLFSAAPYAIFRSVARKNPKLIHFGQYSDKIDNKKYLVLLHELNQRNFTCYFSTNNPVLAPNFPVTVFQNHEAYLKQMAGCGATVILNSIQEGWNRVAHESILVGTPIVVGPGGGPEELAGLLGGLVTDEVATIVSDLEKGLAPVEDAKTRLFGLETATAWAAPLVNFIQHKT
jgi:glycosyltransferase involved in cell wall biosynthesis